MRHSEALRAKIELAGGAAPPSFASLWTSRELDRLFPEFLILLHQIIRASVPLMAAGLEVARMRASRGGDLLCGPISRYLEAHIEEERDHDQWLLDDLEACGWSRTSVWSRIPPAAVANLVGAQYYWIEHHHPIALLGYIAVLEGAPPTHAHIDSVRRATGLPEALFRTYRKHADLDPGHQAEFDRFLDELPMDEGTVALLGLSAINTVGSLGTAVGGLLEVGNHGKTERHRRNNQDRTP